MSMPSLVANAPCLELVNTVNNWHAPDRDLLDEASSAQAWAALVLDDQVALLGPHDLAELRRLRDAVRSVFRAVATGERAGAGALEVLVEGQAAAWSGVRLEPADATYAAIWPSPVDGPVLVGRLATSAVGLLTRGPLERVGECPSCGWLFLDTSRNGRRAWCSMDMCGSRVKARRYYARHHDPGSAQ